MMIKIKQLLSSTQFLFPRTQKFNYTFFPPSKPKKKQQQVPRPPTQQSKKYSHYQIGLYGLIFASCFAAIPMYRLFCQHVGIRGNYDKKTYDFDNKTIVNHKKYLIKFTSTVQPGIAWQFEAVDKQLVIGTAQTAIVFYRLRNKQNRAIVGFATYDIHPQQASLYFSKIQCFCFNQQMINPHQQLLLPIFFYLQPQLIQNSDISRIKQIRINYQFYQSKNQNLAEFAANQIRKAEINKKKLAEIRAQKLNMTVQQYEQYLQEKQLQKQSTPPLINQKIQTSLKKQAQNIQ